MAEESFQNNFFDTEYLKADLKGRSVRGGAVTYNKRTCVSRISLQFVVSAIGLVVLKAAFGLKRKSAQF